MKKILSLIFVIIPLVSMTQLTFDLKGRVERKISSEIPEGTKVELHEIIIGDGGFHKAKVLINDNYYGEILLSQLDRISFAPSNVKEFWQAYALTYGAYNGILKNGLQYKLRKDLEEDAIEYLNYLGRYNLLFEDSYLESYLYTLLYRIYPDPLKDGRQDILNIKILKDISPNAIIFPNGTILVTTGLLSIINSEEELIGVLAHEISHFVFDHYVSNINKAAERKKRAEFWAAFATGIAAVADGYIASKNEYYAPGAITLSTAVLAYSIAASVNERLGLKYSRIQEMEADNFAVELMKFIDVNPLALSTALSKIKNYCILTGDYLSLTGEGSHPAIDERINKIGKPYLIHDTDYDKRVSFVNSFNAIGEFNNLHLTSCANLVQRNIKAKVATEEDYLLLAMITLYKHNTEEKNKEALDLITKAKSLNVFPSINIPKQESIALIRLKKYEDAKICLQQYREGLEKEKINLDKIYDSREWSYLNNYINNEYEWTVKMIFKVDKL